MNNRVRTDILVKVHPIAVMCGSVETIVDSFGKLSIGCIPKSLDTTSGNGKPGIKLRRRSGCNTRNAHLPIGIPTTKPPQLGVIRAMSSLSTDTPLSLLFVFSYVYGVGSVMHGADASKAVSRAVREVISSCQTTGVIVTDGATGCEGEWVWNYV